MRLYEIIMPLSAEDKAEIDRICAPHMPADVRAAIENEWRRAPPARLSPGEMQAMYGHDVERENLELEQLRLDNEKTRAEIEALDAKAARDRAASRR